MKAELLKRGIEEIISQDSFKKRLSSGKKLRIKFGVDPSSPDIHLGHSVILRKLKQFQEMGHKVIFLLGDYTAMIGDPSGVNKTRPVLSNREILANAKTYINQVGKILDIKKAEIRRNSEWYNNISLKEMIELGSKFSVAGIIERDDFESRLSSGKEIAFHELYYLIMQAYDSVVLRADVEVGGTEQKFNMLAARALQKKMGQVPQEVITFELLVGICDRDKMSKSLGNYIGISESPSQQFGKIMSIPDKLITDYFTLCTDYPLRKISNMKIMMKKGKNPRDYKEKLAYKIVSMYHGKEKAEEAKKQFIKQFRKKEVPDNVKKIKVEGNFELVLLLIDLEVASSKTQARRLIEQGAVKIDGVKITDIKAIMGEHPGMIIQVGRNFWKTK